MPSDTANSPTPLPDSHTNDVELVDLALSGDEAAARAIRSTESTAQIENILRRRGASATEAKDIVEDLWADCFDSSSKRGALLDRYTGKGPLEGFLTRTALNRLIDLKRRQKFQGSLPRQEHQESGDAVDAFDSLPGESTATDTDDALVGILRDSLVKAFALCDPEKLVILRLVNVHGLDQSTVGHMWGWSQSKISRALTSLMEEVRGHTIAEIKRQDPWLELQWEDFVSLCSQCNDIFSA